MKARICVRALLFLVAMQTSFAFIGPAFAQKSIALTPTSSLSVEGSIRGKKKSKPATDVSGMACRGAAGKERVCLIVNDENKAAQVVRLRGLELIPGNMIELIGDAPAKNAVGSPPSSRCRADGKFADFDGEGVAFADGYFYVAGSHGCSRNKGEFRLSSFYLARVALDDAGVAASRVDLTYRLADVLRAAQPAASRFTLGLDAKSNGLNIEGIAVSGGTLWAGLRAPVDDGKAYIVGAPVAALFAPGPTRWSGAPQVLALQLGEHRGVRDLAALADGRLLVLSGPAQGQDIDYRLHVVDPAQAAAPVLLGALEKLKHGKAESITVLAQSGNEVEFAVLFDGLENGSGRIYRITTPH